MSRQGAGGVLIVRIEMHLAAAMKILGNATNNLQGRLLSHAFFAHLSSFIIYGHDMSSKPQRVGQPAFASSSEKVVTTHRPTHAEMMFDKIFLARKGFMAVCGYIPEGLGQGLSSIQRNKNSAATKALSYTCQVSQAKMPPKVCLYSALRMNGENQRCTRMLKRCQVQLTKFHLNTRLPPANMQFFPCVARAAKDCSQRHNDSNDSWKCSFKIGQVKKTWKKSTLSASHIGKLKRDSASNSHLSDSSHRGLSPKLIFGARHVVLDKCAWFSSWVAMRRFGVNEDLLRLDQETQYDISWYSVLN